MQSHFSTGFRRSMLTALILASAYFLSSCSRRHQEQPHMLARAHAHNDYQHTRPLLDALDNGFGSIEADIHLVDGELYVAHGSEDIRPDRTLRRLYLDPLLERVKANEGSVYGDGGQVILLIDLKTDAMATYKVLAALLAEYKQMLSKFTPEGETRGAVRAIVTGGPPLQYMSQEPERFAAGDGDFSVLGSSLPVSLVPLVSESWTSHFTWAGDGDMPEGERAAFQSLVDRAHKDGRLIRFWATPDDPLPSRDRFWSFFWKSDVDLLNTDDLPGLREFIRAQEKGTNK